MSVLEMKYFVLKPEGSDPFAIASRRALVEFAHGIHPDNPELAEDIFTWVRTCSKRARTMPKVVTISEDAYTKLLEDQEILRVLSECGLVFVKTSSTRGGE